MLDPLETRYCFNKRKDGIEYSFYLSIEHRLRNYVETNFSDCIYSHIDRVLTSRKLAWNPQETWFNVINKFLNFASFDWIDNRPNRESSRETDDSNERTSKRIVSRRPSFFWLVEIYKSHLFFKLFNLFLPVYCHLQESGRECSYCAVIFANLSVEAHTFPPKNVFAKILFHGSENHRYLNSG